MKNKRFFLRSRGAPPPPPLIRKPMVKWCQCEWSLCFSVGNWHKCELPHPKTGRLYFLPLTLEELDTCDQAFIKRSTKGRAKLRHVPLVPKQTARLATPDPGHADASTEAAGFRGWTRACVSESRSPKFRYGEIKGTGSPVRCSSAAGPRRR